MIYGKVRLKYGNSHKKRMFYRKNIWYVDVQGPIEALLSIGPYIMPMDAFGPSISLLPLDGLSLDINTTYVCGSAPNGSPHSITVEAGNYFIFCNYVSSGSTTSFGTVFVYIMSSSNNSKVYPSSDISYYFQFTNATTFEAYAYVSSKAFTASLVKINS